MTLAIDSNLNLQLENYSISSKTAIITGLIGSINRGIMQLNIIIIITISSSTNITILSKPGTKTILESVTIKISNAGISSISRVIYFIIDNRSTNISWKLK